MTKNNPTNKEKKESLAAELSKQMLGLATGGLGLVAALAWNDAVNSFIDEWIKPYAARGTGFTSQLLYAIIITALAVFVTYQLTKLSQRFQQKEDED